tara:strand:- start:1397 stop:1780 length:384 start_codon:yes stop_codon:yes gene_type:complete
MRIMAYAVAALAAVGIAIMIVSMPDVPEEVVAKQAAAKAKSDARVMSESGELTLSVPDMHCPFACYPAIKETLEKTDTVESVELAKQKEEGVIDNRQVIVHYKSGFNLDDAIKLLDDRGFSDSDIVQ